MNGPGFNPLVSQLSPPAIPSVQAWGRSYDGAYGGLIDLSQAAPGHPPHPDMLRWMAEAAASPVVARYGLIEGDPDLRAAYADYLAKAYQTRLGAKNVLLTSGCNQAFAIAATVIAEAGDAVLLSRPCYFNHETTLSMMGVEPRFFSCRPEDGFVPRIDDIAAALDGRVKALALVTPNNPTGADYPPSLLADILALCRENDIWLILDETYRDFAGDDGAPPHSLFGIDGWENNLIQLYSFSKSFAIPGHRLGAIAAGAEVIRQATKVMDNLQICAPRIPQYAVCRGLDALAGWRAENRMEIAQRGRAMQSAFADLPGWDIRSIGAYFAFVSHPFAGAGSGEVAERLARDFGVVTIPGSYFGDGLDPFLRFAFANVDAGQIAEAVQRLRLAG